MTEYWSVPTAAIQNPMADHLLRLAPDHCWDMDHAERLGCVACPSCLAVPNLVANYNNQERGALPKPQIIKSRFGNGCAKYASMRLLTNIECGGGSSLFSLSHCGLQGRHPEGRDADTSGVAERLGLDSRLRGNDLHLWPSVIGRRTAPSAPVEVCISTHLAVVLPKDFEL
jgi:hypothetical protein